MSILFYDHLINKTEIHLHIDSLHSDKEHQTHIKQLVDEIIHHEIINFLLKKLKNYHHDPFLERLESAPYDPEILYFLKENIHPEIEDQLADLAQKIIFQIKLDLEL